MNSQTKINHNLLNYSCLIKLPNHQSTGSGIFVTNGNSTFLVTAKHVLYDIETNELLDRNLEIIYYFDVVKGSQNSIILDLNGLQREGRVLSDSINDIAVVKIGNRHKENEIHLTHILYQNTPDQVSSFPIEFFTFYDEVPIGEDVLMLGYPSSLGLKELPNYDFSRPLLRSGIVAGKSNRNRTIIIDASAFGGNSGGPVFMKKNDKYSIIGLVVQFIPYQNNIYGEQGNIVLKGLENSGYSILEAPDKIRDLMEKIN